MKTSFFLNPTRFHSVIFVAEDGGSVLEPKNVKKVGVVANVKLNRSFVVA